MTHHFTCSNCHHENKIKISTGDRGEFQMKFGDYVDTICNSCHKKEKTHINKIYAVVSQRNIIFGCFLGLILAVFLIFFIPKILIVSTGVASLPLLIYANERKMANSFNKYKIKVR